MWVSSRFHLKCVSIRSSAVNPDVIDWVKTWTRTRCLLGLVKLGLGSDTARTHNCYKCNLHKQQKHHIFPRWSPVQIGCSPNTNSKAKPHLLSIKIGTITCFSRLWASMQHLWSGTVFIFISRITQTRVPHEKWVLEKKKNKKERNTIYWLAAPNWQIKDTTTTDKTRLIKRNDNW